MAFMTMAQDTLDSARNLRPRHARLRIVALLAVAINGASEAQTATTASRPGGAVPATTLATRIDQALADPFAAKAHWGIVVTTLSGETLYARNEGELFRPASTAKLFTTAAALERLANEPAFTLLQAPQPSADGTITGDLTLTGYGDANLSGRRLPYETPAQHNLRLQTDATPDDPLHAMDEIAASVAQRGVRHITGSILAQQAGFDEPYPDGWAVDDQLWGYGAPISLLAVNDNQVELRITPGGATGDPLRVNLSPDVGELSVLIDARTQPAGATAALQLERTADPRQIRLFGTLPLGAHEVVEHVSVPSPKRFAAEALRERLLAHGVQVDGEARAQAQPLTDARSFRTASQMLATSALPAPFQVPATAESFQLRWPAPSLLDDVTITLKDSLNLHAEMLLRRMGWQLARAEDHGEDRSYAIEGERAVRATALQAGIRAEDFTFYDGSGLSTYDVVTPRAMTGLLLWAQSRPWFAGWKSALPVGGVDGTLANRFHQASLQGRVLAKTGTLGESQALAGYLTCSSGRTVVFAIFADTHLPGHSTRPAIDQLVATIADAF